MFRYRKRKKIFEGRFPRIRGDVPWALAPGQNSSWFSPHTRGCSWWLRCARPLGCVFPAYAGMFLSVRVMRRVSSGFPRIRGDVPLGLTHPRVGTPFSPHTRGCSATLYMATPYSCVFPAYAGMFLYPPLKLLTQGGFPRIRGDVPPRTCRLSPAWRFSPHTRGCSDQLLPMIEHGRVFPHTRGCSWKPKTHKYNAKVFPAYAGMFPFSMANKAGRSRFPRIRGDVPHSNCASGVGDTFSPHTRGCSQQPYARSGGAQVFPAYAGMFRRPWPPPTCLRRFPRIRGDVPSPPGSVTAPARFSPHTRGCSRLRHPGSGVCGVFPAYAGMFPCVAYPRCMPQSFPRIRGDVPSCSSGRRCRLWFSPHTRGCSARQQPTCSTVACFPRIRGDVPVRPQILNNPEAFSPHTRGCSAPTMPPIMAAIVFPAYAGMFRSGGDEAGHNSSFPRIRGDVPSYPYWAYLTCLFSPHTRGCSRLAAPNSTILQVFPAYAGMFLLSTGFGKKGERFSPHTRGCSAPRPSGVCESVVFPAYAGMFRHGRVPRRG